MITSMNFFLSLPRDRSTVKEGSLPALNLGHPGKAPHTAGQGAKQQRCTLCSVHGCFHQPIRVWPFQTSHLNFQKSLSNPPCTLVF